jgi:hypothetical protein
MTRIEGPTAQQGTPVLNDFSTLIKANNRFVFARGGQGNQQWI